MLPTAHLAHQIKGRLRLRVPEKRKDRGWFAQTASRLERLPGVLRVDARSLSGSLLIYHRLGPSWERRLSEAGRFRIAVTPPDLEQAAETLHLSAQTLQSPTDRRGELKTLVIGGLILLAIVQAIRGKVMVPAISLLFFAYNLAATAKDKAQD